MKSAFLIVQVFFTVLLSSAADGDVDMLLMPADESMEAFLKVRL